MGISSEDKAKLQSLLRTSILGAESYKRLIRDVKAEDITRKFRSYGKDYEEFAAEIVGVMESNGASPVKSSGTVGKMAEMSYRMQNIANKSTLRMLEAAYKGELRALEKATKMYATANDEVAKRTIAKNLAASKRRSEELMKLILSYEIEDD